MHSNYMLILDSDSYVAMTQSSSKSTICNCIRIALYTTAVHSLWQAYPCSVRRIRILLSFCATIYTVALYLVRAGCASSWPGLHREYGRGSVLPHKQGANQEDCRSRASIDLTDQTRNDGASQGTNDLQLWELPKGHEVESGLGQEAFQEAAPVLHLPEPGVNQRGQLIDVVLCEVGQRSFQVGPDRFNRVQFAVVRRELVDGQPVPGCEQLAHRAADVGVQIVPDQYDRAVQLLVGGVQEPGVVRLGEPLALISPPCAVGAVDQPGTAAGPDGDQRGQRHPRVVAGGHRHHRGAAAAPPGASLRRPQALAGLVFEAEPGAQVRRRPFMTGQVSSCQAAMASSSRSAARRAGTGRSSRSGAAAHPVRPACSPPRTARRPARRSGPASSTGPASPRRPARHPAPPPARATGRGSACTGPRPRPWRPAPASRRPPAPAATGSPTS